MVQSHPSPALLDRFAAGDLPIAPALVVECHLEACPACAASVSQREADHGLALANLPDARLRADALERALAELSPRAPRPMQIADVPLPRALIRQGLHTRRFLGPDFWLAAVRRSRRDTWRAYVLRAPANAKIPPHRHLGLEYFRVLMGSVTDGGPHVAGDFVGGAAGSDHALQVGADGPCACLIAVEHGAQWRGVTRLLSPWLGI